MINLIVTFVLPSFCCFFFGSGFVLFFLFIISEFVFDRAGYSEFMGYLLCCALCHHFRALQFMLISFAG